MQQTANIIPRPAKAAEILGVSIPTIYRLVKAGELQKIKVGTRATGIIGLDAFIERRTREG